MYMNILVAIDPSHEHAREALEMATHLAENTSAAITALTVVEPLPAFVAAEVPQEIDLRQGEEAMNHLREFVGPRSDIRTEVRHGRAGQTIVDYATEDKSDCIVIASHKPGMADYFLGSTAARVVRHAPCSVHVMR